MLIKAVALQVHAQKVQSLDRVAPVVWTVLIEALERVRQRVQHFLVGHRLELFEEPSVLRVRVDEGVETVHDLLSPVVEGLGGQAEVEELEDLALLIDHRLDGDLHRTSFRELSKWYKRKLFDLHCHVEAGDGSALGVLSGDGLPSEVHVQVLVSSVHGLPLQVELVAKVADPGYQTDSVV